MLEVKVTIATTPELTGVLNSFVTAINGKAQPVPTTQTSVHTLDTATHAPMPVAPVQATTKQIQTPATPVASVPLANASQFSVEQIMTAGATLMDAGKIEDLMNLLRSFGVQAVTELKPEQLGAFATEMRKLGAAI